jgi:tRNA pseudouridine38-40 synthase
MFERSWLEVRYIYFIFNGEELPAMLSGRVGQVKTPLNMKVMQRAAKEFTGRRDFSVFCVADEDQKSSVRRVHEVKVGIADEELLKLQGNTGRLLYVRISANAFLYKMVRFIVGALIETGKGRLGAGDIKRMLMGDIQKKPKPAVACGLYLNNVKY